MAVYTYRYPHPAVTVDVVVLAGEAEPRVLLIRRSGAPFQGAWALPGGFVGMDEPLEAAARRELAEETGLVVSNLLQIGAFGAPDRDPRERVITVAYLAVLQDDELPEVRAGSDARTADWFGLDALPELAFDHRDIVARALEIWRGSGS